ncbi:MAG: hypothetical protein JW940_13605 [Polyangiaceae bacterium]|nr:hypothetical protein [Polyangiaceae bacterium]
MTVTIGIIHCGLVLMSDPAFRPVSESAPVAALSTGVVLVGCWFGRRSAPTLVLILAAAVWSTSLVLPLLLAPAQTVLGIASPGGVALTLARLVVLFMLVRGVPASIQIRRLLVSQV